MLSFKSKKIAEIMEALDPIPWEGVALLDDLMAGTKLGTNQLWLVANKFYESHNFVVASTCIKVSSRGK